MENDRVLLFHIGTLKTGTTSLQNFLYINQDKLKNEGWNYPHFTEIKNPNIKFDQRNGQSLLVSFLKKDDDTFEECLNYIEENLKTHNIIISAEGIWRLNNIDEFFSKIVKHFSNINIKVVVYLRRQDQYLESIYNQFVKTIANETRNLDQFVEYAEQNKITRYIDKLTKLENVLGENLIVKRFEKESFQGSKKDIISDFFSIIGIEDKIKDWQYSKKVESQNISLGSRFLEIKRILNKVYNSYNFYSPYTTLIKTLNNRNVSEDEKDYYKILSPELRKKILKNHEQENIEITKHFFNDNKPLFTDENVNIPYKQYHATPFEEEFIKMFFNILIRQELNLKFLHSLNNKKKLAYFGAGKICRNFLNKGIYTPNVIIDNKVSNIKIDNIPVVTPDSIENLKDYQIIITCANYEDIEKQLQEKKLGEGADYIKYFDLLIDGSLVPEVFKVHNLFQKNNNIS